MSLSLASCWFASGGFQKTDNTNFFAVFFAQFTISGAIVGTLAWVVITTIQWVWVDEWRSPIWLGATAVSTALFVKGFWWLGIGFVTSPLDWAFAPDGVAPLVLINVVTLAFMGAISLFIDIWPEKTLVTKD